MGTVDKEYTRQVLTAIVNYSGEMDMLFNKKFLKLQDHFDLQFVDVDKDTIRVTSTMKKEETKI